VRLALLGFGADHALDLLAAALARDVRARSVGRDLVEPGAKARASFELVDATEDGEPRFLKHVIRRFGRHEKANEPRERCRVSSDERGEGGLVSTSDAARELAVFGCGLRACEQSESCR
jgi:hypothetical protein